MNPDIEACIQGIVVGLDFCKTVDIALKSQVVHE